MIFERKSRSSGAMTESRHISMGLAAVTNRHNHVMIQHNRILFLLDKIEISSLFYF